MRPTLADLIYVYAELCTTDLLTLYSDQWGYCLMDLFRCRVLNRATPFTFTQDTCEELLLYRHILPPPFKLGDRMLEALTTQNWVLATLEARKYYTPRRRMWLKNAAHRPKSKHSALHSFDDICHIVKAYYSK